MVIKLHYTTARARIPPHHYFPSNSPQIGTRRGTARVTRGEGRTCGEGATHGEGGTRGKGGMHGEGGTCGEGAT
jgi:hypothetical protein